MFTVDEKQQHNNSCNNLLTVVKNLVQLVKLCYNWYTSNDLRTRSKKVAAVSEIMLYSSEFLLVKLMMIMFFVN